MHVYLLALGSNMRRVGVGSPDKVLGKAIGEIAREVTVTSRSRTIASRPLGPSRRRFANGAIVVETKVKPRPMLALVKSIERKFGRRRGRRWGQRVLDIDIILWSGGMFAEPDLLIPHPAFRGRDFVLGPASEIAGDWRDPVTGLTVRQLRSRLRKAA